MTQLAVDTPVPVVWLWMFIVGLGVGPTFSVFTIVIQNAVPFRQLGVATSNLTFFRQIGGTIALAFVGTIFGTTFQEQIGPQMATAGVPPDVIGTFFAALQAGVIDFNVLTGVGGMGLIIAGLLPAVAPNMDASSRPGTSPLASRPPRPSGSASAVRSPRPSPQSRSRRSRSAPLTRLPSRRTPSARRRPNRRPPIRSAPERRPATDLALLCSTAPPAPPAGPFLIPE